MSEENGAARRVTIAELAEQLGIKEKNLYQWVQSHAAEIERAGGFKPAPEWQLPPSAVEYIKERYRTARGK